MGDLRSSISNQSLCSLYSFQVARVKSFAAVKIQEAEELKQQLTKIDEVDDLKKRLDESEEAHKADKDKLNAEVETLRENAKKADEWMASAHSKMEESEKERRILATALASVPVQDEVDGVVRATPLFKKGKDPKAILKGLSEGQDTPRLLIRAVAKTGQGVGQEFEESEPPPRALFGEAHDDEGNVVEDLTIACEKLVQEREVRRI